MSTGGAAAARFAELERRWAALDSAPLQVAGGPAAEDTITAALVTLDLPLVDAAFDWFGWRGGNYRTHPTNPSPDARGLGGDMMALLNLRDAVATTQLMRTVTAEVAANTGTSMSHYWRHELLAITDDTGGDLLAIDMTEAGAGRIHLHEKGQDLRLLTANLADLADRWIEQIDTGVVVWSAEDARWMPAHPDRPVRY